MNKWHSEQALTPSPWAQARCLEQLAPGTAIVLPAASTGQQHVPPAGPNLLGAEDDVAAARAFLREHEGQPATLRSYTKEVERLLLWLMLVRKKSLAQLDRADFAAYSAFLADPQPRAQWCGPRLGSKAKRFSPSWRPFVGPLRPEAQRMALIVINALMNYLMQAQYVRANALGLMRPQASRAHSDITAQEHVGDRAFDEEEWQALVASIAPLPADVHVSQTLRLERARERYIVAVLYFLALRVGELVTHTMGHFRLRNGLWRFSVLGKGQKAAQIPVNDALLAELQQFRRALMLPPLPSTDEHWPLVPRSDGSAAPLGARRINQILKTIVNRAADLLQAKSPGKAAHMRQASAHWFRHTSLTRQVQAGLSLTDIRANARHSKMDTTMLYVHTEQDARHRAMQQHAWLHADGKQGD